MLLGFRLNNDKTDVSNDFPRNCGLIFFLYSIKNFANILLIKIPTNYVTILQRLCHMEGNTMSTLQQF